ncbi:hypothetical protein ACFO9Q_15610 [Paenibacillus sp. GCM10023252]|uniref:hypothetical protein n=1 Tax=Paenibacillus sp. GCM10023252 TaxID=3252649 RepID=UPI00361AD42A
MELYFRDNFFNAGSSDIMDAEGNHAGSLDLRSAFGSGLDVYNGQGLKMCAGEFPFFSNKWHITTADDCELGVLRARMSFLKKKYEYDSGGRGIYEIVSPAFSNEYAVLDEDENEVASFAKISGWLHPGAFCLNNQSQHLDHYELIAIVMGVHAIQKRQNASIAGSTN